MSLSLPLLPFKLEMSVSCLRNGLSSVEYVQDAHIFVRLVSIVTTLCKINNVDTLVRIYYLLHN